MESKNPKSQPKLQAPPLVQEADELRFRSNHVSVKAHDHAGLAYLFELILTDPIHSAVSERLMLIFKSAASMRENCFELSELLTQEAKDLHIHPVLLASAMIWWGHESDVADNETVGSADWQLFPLNTRNLRRDLRAECKVLGDEIDAIFRGSGIDPDSAIQLVLQKCKALESALITLLKSIHGHQGKRKRLFYASSKTEIRAYYLTRVRKLRTDSPELHSLLDQAGEKFDWRQRDDRLRAQKKIHDWARAFETLVDALMLDLGFRRQKRTYICLDD